MRALRGLCGSWRYRGIAEEVDRDSRGVILRNSTLMIEVAESPSLEALGSNCAQDAI